MRTKATIAPAPSPSSSRLLLPLGAALWALAGCSHGGEQGMHGFPPIDVTTMTVTARDVPLTFEYLGRTEGSREVEVRARVSGFLDSRHFVEGSMVAAGDLLFQIDKKPLEAQAAAAAAEIAVADARWQQAERERQRFEDLLKDDAASKKDRDDAVAAAAIAKAQLDAATARRDQIELDLRYTRVTAPIAGRIGRALRPEGSLVDAGPQGLLTTLLQLDPIYVDFHRTENQQFAFDGDVKTGRIAVPEGGLQVEIRHRDGTVLASGGAIDFTDGRLDTTTGTIPMRATLPNKDLRLRAGQAVKVVLRGAVLNQAVAVPQRVVVDSPQGKVVFTIEVKDGKTIAAARSVDVAEWVELQDADGPTQRYWIVRRGLAPGERIAVDGLVKLARMPGMPVHVVDPAPAAAPTTAPADAPAAAPAKNEKGN